ncbi:hypothetical protein SORDD16_00411 [Streptococcus oralis]|uniref:Uncharacterized protein n=1 Tax=Streptococcus oralis TaxID=1303 RepID=A0A139PFD4_STROR|nr:hypothetical protein SORDD16_00411 [Streptococcus oralis]
MLFYILLIGNFLSLPFVERYPVILAQAYPVAMLIITLLLAFYVANQARKAGLTAIGPENLKPKEKEPALCWNQRSFVWHPDPGSHHPANF